MNISNVLGFVARTLKLSTLLWLSSSLGAQSLLPLEQELRLVECELLWALPTQTPYRPHKRVNNRFQATDFAIEVRREDLFIRYLMEPANAEEDRDVIPHVRASALAMHLASNEEDSYLSVHQIAPALVDSVYQADWAQTYFFKPKDRFSLSTHCQMTAIYREGVALAYIFLLFEEAPNSLPLYAESLRFRARKFLD